MISWQCIHIEWLEALNCENWRLSKAPSLYSVVRLVDTSKNWRLSKASSLYSTVRLVDTSENWRLSKAPSLYFAVRLVDTCRARKTVLSLGPQRSNRASRVMSFYVCFVVVCQCCVLYCLELCGNFDNITLKYSSSLSAAAKRSRHVSCATKLHTL